MPLEQDVAALGQKIAQWRRDCHQPELDLTTPDKILEVAGRLICQAEARSTIKTIPDGNPVSAAGGGSIELVAVVNGQQFVSAPILWDDLVVALWREK